VPLARVVAGVIVPAAIGVVGRILVRPLWPTAGRREWRQLLVVTREPASRYPPAGMLLVGLAWWEVAGLAATAWPAGWRPAPVPPRSWCWWREAVSRLIPGTVIAWRLMPWQAAPYRAGV
jgi:hypothetical protein